MSICFFFSSFYFGLQNIKAVANSARSIITERSENGKFSSIGDFVLRTSVKKNVFASLVKAGALDSLYPDRMALIAASAYICDAAKDYKTLSSELKAKLKLNNKLIQGDIEGAMAMNEGKKVNQKVLTRRISHIQSQLQEATEILDGKIPHFGSGNRIEMLQMEKEAIGVFISGSVLDGFNQVAKVNGQTITSLNDVEGNADILGFPINAERAIGKKSQKEFMTFDAVTHFGTIRCVCFEQNTMDQLEKLSVPVILSGKLKANENGSPEMVVFKTKNSTRQTTDITLYPKNVAQWCDICELIEKHKYDRKKTIHITGWGDNLMEEFRVSDAYCSEDLLKEILNLFPHIRYQKAF